VEGKKQLSVGLVAGIFVGTLIYHFLFK